ncbi:Rho guanine nucleotide exchange factor [Microbotryomycetes sp. JL201]|nr:Rho guanine nucleotide exchange factor [Microbotryomycetes sp. JL201]
MSGPQWSQAQSFYSSHVSGTYSIPAAAQRGPVVTLDNGPYQPAKDPCDVNESLSNSSEQTETSSQGTTPGWSLRTSPANTISEHSLPAAGPSSSRTSPLTGTQAFPQRHQSYAHPARISSPSSEALLPPQAGPQLRTHAPGGHVEQLTAPPSFPSARRARESVASGIISMYSEQWDSRQQPLQHERQNGWNRNPSFGNARSGDSPAQDTVGSATPPSWSPNHSFSAVQRVDSALSTTSSRNDAARGNLDSREGAFLSALALHLRDNVPRSRQTKGFTEHPNAFTGRDVVSTLMSALAGVSADRHQALTIARSLHQALWFHEIDWSDSLLRDGLGQAFIFFEDEGITSSLEQDVDVPQGVLTAFTDCYSPSCSKSDSGSLAAGCYAYSCPRRRTNRLQRHGSSVSSLTPTDFQTEEAEAWETSVPSSVVDSLSKKQVKVQNLIFELIQGEIKYLQDLELVESGFVEPLRAAQPPIIHQNRLDGFLEDVLLNMAHIRELSRSFLSMLLEKQKESLVFHGIGQIILAAALDWTKAYVFYVSRFPMADWILKDETARNPRLAQLLQEFQRLPQANRRGFDTFHNRVMPRGLRYDMFLDSIYQAQDEDDPDRPYVQQARAVIKQQASEANTAVKETENMVAKREFGRDLLFKNDSVIDLELLAPERRFFKAGKALRRADGAGFSEWVDVHLVLFDNYLVVTKPRRERDGQYPISRRLRPSSFSDKPVVRSSGFHLRSARLGGTDRQPSVGSQSASSAGLPISLVYPITFYQLGRHQGLVQYFVDSASAREQWEKAVREALSVRANLSARNRVYDLEALADQTFGAAPAIGSLAAVDGAALQNQTGPPTCSSPLATQDGQSLVLAGCSEGLFVGFRGKPRSMRQVVHLNDITQCAILPDSGFVLVLANRVLIAYTLEALIPSGRKTEQAIKDAKRSGVKESVFKALEPVSPTDKAKTGAAHRFLGFGKSSTDWFRAHKEFFMPTQVTCLQFHRSKLALVGPKGVEIMDLDSMRFSSDAPRSYDGVIVRPMQGRANIGNVSSSRQQIHTGTLLSTLVGTANQLRAP